MNAKGGLTLFFGVMLATPLVAQGFADLGTRADNFAVPERGKSFDFPADHGPHPKFRIEWWYLTATLQDDSGRDYGIQWTLFRQALEPQDGTGWHTPQLWMGHAALTSPEDHFFAERLARGGIGQAGADAVPFRAWIDDWTMTGTAATEEDAVSSLTLQARGTEFAYDLKLSAQVPIVFHGDGGYSVKSRDGQASYYYSQPSYRVGGTITLPSGTLKVTGEGWLDREWSSQPLSENQTGWDWFSLSFENGARMMGFRLRGDGPGFTSATWIGADGSTETFDDGALQLTPMKHAQVADRRIPIRWQLALPAKELMVEVDAVNDQSWMGTSYPYWEGPVRVSGSHEGRGYLEMTGY